MKRFPKILALVAGGVSAIGFAPLDLWPVTIFAFAFWMWLVAEAPDVRGALARGWWFGVGHFTIGLNWIAGSFRYQDTMPVWLGWVAVVVLALYLAIYPAMAAGLAWRWGRPRRAVYILIFAAAWVVTEYLRATLFTGFAWNPLGVAFVGVAQLTTLIGTYAFSAVVILSAGALYMLAQRRWLAAGALAALPAFVALIGFASIPEPDVDLRLANQPLVRVIQPNIGQQDKHDESFDEINWNKLATLTGLPGDTPRLILWPEAAVPYFLEEERWAVDRIARLMGPKDMLLTGGDSFIWDKAGKDIVGAYNSVHVVTPKGSLAGRYDKAHLVPYGEYLPMRPILSAIGLSRLVEGDLDFLAGPGPRTLDLRPQGFGTVGIQICYEIIFSGEVVQKGYRRPDFIFNPSNDAWFGAWGSPQFVAQSRLRAIEEGLPVIRATPTGISAVIDSNGAVRVALPTGKAGVIQTALPPSAPPTLFARLGHIMTALTVLTLIGFAIALRRWQR